MKVNPDNILIRNLVKGDVSAMDVIYIRYAPQVRAFLNKVIPGLRGEDIEDITHDIFLKIWELRDGLNEGESLSAYIFTMAKNAALNEVKHAKVAKKYASSHQRENVTYFDPEHEFLAKESVRRTSDIISSLDDKQKKIFLENRFEDKTYKDIANEHHLSPKTVQYHISEVLKKLRGKI